MSARPAYRLRQFLLAWTAKPASGDLAQAQQLLGPRLWLLFLQQQPGEQAHSLDVLKRITTQGHTDPDLLVAALLHDVGKSRAPLTPWDRTWIVLAKRIAPQRVRHWGSGSPTGWKRIFVVAEQHPAWGAEMAAAAGASPSTVRLIAQHQNRRPDLPAPLAESLRILQGADDES
ncbi:MAG: HDIG domain-containing metalloprotein [Chloroflexota bacterium]